MGKLDAIRDQLTQAAQAFATDAHPVGEILGAMVDDVARAEAEPLEIFPVAHHSPAAAVQLVRRLTERPPRLIYMEGCEDMLGTLEHLRDCRLPVALQAFAQESDAFPAAWSPLSIVAPLTEFSAEFQAIAFTMANPSTELVFVDRSVDHIFQWMPQEDEELERRVAHDVEDEGAEAVGEDEEKQSASHGAALGVQMGVIEPTFDAFLSFLLRNARVSHFAEWWDQYVEQAVLGADHATYKQVMCLVGSLLRRLGRKDADVESDRMRERFMWTRMKEHLAEKKVAPSDALYICGAIHAVSDVEEYGTRSNARWEIPARTATKWLYGMIPSSYAAIERQFHHPAGTIALAEKTWHKAQAALGVTPFKIDGAKAAKGSKAPKAPKKAAAGGTVSATKPPPSGALLSYLTRPPQLGVEDEEQLLAWCVDIVQLARKNGYLSSTADSIAVYHTSVLIANLRNRSHPSPYDFQDAAITCLEKDRTPKKRNIRRLCEIVLGGDRVGRVGYSSLPPLAQDVYDRLAPLGISLQSGRIERALMDIRQRPELRPCSDLLWCLNLLLGNVVRPIMGERALGKVAQQESWDIGIGKHQASIIQLGYEGVSVEHVLEKRLKAKAFAEGTKVVAALEAAEQALLYLRSARLTEELGERAVDLLRQEEGAGDAPQVFERIRRLVHHYRSTPTGLPEWVKRFVTTGYSHYATLLPNAFADRGTRPEAVAAMLAFLFTLESLALSLGCQRSQLLIAVGQAGPLTDDPTKLGLLWAAEWLLQLREIAQIREYLDQVLANPLMLPAFPQYVTGFLLALGFTPLVGRLVVELLSKAFERLPDEILFPWTPGLLMALRPHAADLLPPLLKEASLCFPQKLAQLGSWQPPWEKQDGAPVEEVAADDAQLDPDEAAAHALLLGARATTDAMAALLGEPVTWSEVSSAPPPKPSAAPTADAGSVAELLQAHPAALEAMVRLLG